jgi:RimJ/RimL family protein N-acetyltransferase
MEFTIRQAQPDDAGQLIAHVRRLIQEPGIQIPLHPDEFTLTTEQQRQMLSEALHSKSSVFLVADVDGQVIGEINCKRGARRAFDHAVTLGMSVCAKWRNKGVGSELMKEAVAWAKSSGAVARVELFVYANNAAAIHLYEKFGFEVEGRRRQAVRQDGRFIDDLVMARLL